MARFPQIYFIRNNAGTYEAWQEDEASATYSGSSLVTNVLNSIESANSSGDFVCIFGVGTFDMGTDNWTMVDMDTISLIGAGMGATIIQNSSTAAADTEPFSFTRCNRVTVQDMTISAGGSVRQSSDGLDFDNGNDCVVRRVHILNARGDGIVFDGKDASAESVNNLIDSCIVGGAGSTVNFSGIQLLVTDRCQVVNSQISQCGEVGIKINRQVSASRYSERNIIANNIIEENDEAGIEILESRDNIIANNIIRNNGQTGAGTDDGILIDYFGNAGLEPIRNIVRGNVFIDDQTGVETQDTGVRIQDSQTADTIITGNTFSGHVTAGIFDTGTDTIIRDNVGYPDRRAREVSGTYTLTILDPGAINVDSSGGAGSLTLPDNATAVGKVYVIRRDGTNSVTITRAGTDTFDDASTSKTLGADGSAIGILSIGDGEWKIVSTEGTVT